MRALLRFWFPMIALALGLGACASDEEAPGDELAAQGKIPDGTFQGNEFQGLVCHVTLVYCRDPRYPGNPRTYCSNGCTQEEAESVAYSICRRICGNIDCNDLLNLGGC
jgi:hypothetical protein